MIDLRMTTDEKDLVSAVAGSASALFPIQESIDAAMSGRTPVSDEARWSQIAELGWFSLRASEAAEGLGMRLVDEVLVLIELGRLCAPGPFVGSMLAARLADLAGEASLLDELTSGRATVGLRTGQYAVHAAPGSYLLEVGPESRLVRVVEALEVDGIDESTPTFRVLATEPVVTFTHEVRPDLQVMLSAYLVGVSLGATTRASEYAQIRHQFDQPIGAFQAVKHRCAEMAIRAHAARAQLLVAALLVDDEDPDAGVLEAASAYFLASEAAQQNVDDGIQNHGGIGFTAEHAAGVFIKRARVYMSLGGTQASLVGTLLRAPRTAVA